MSRDPEKQALVNDNPTPGEFPPFAQHRPVLSGPNLPRVPQGNMGYRRLSADAELLIPRPSIILPQLQVNEKRFFQLVHAGNVNAVKDFLAENPDFNINCVNFQGVSGLLVAVQAHLEPMVEFLLSQPGIEIGDCVLHAVRDNQPKILDMLLDQLQLVSPSLEFIGVTNSSDFPDHVTPLILAAQCGHYEIIQMLIERGHVISKPHSPMCRCSGCKEQLARDDLLHAETLRLNLYRAVTNPAYICHSTHDPILAAFQLCQELRQCSMLVPEFRAAYAELAEGVSTFAVDLIGCCRTTGEIELILKQSGGFHSTCVFVYPRLVLAMDYKQKAFVAHPNTQQILESAWNGDWHEYKLKPVIVAYLYPLYRLLMLPLITVMCIAMPNHPLVKHWTIPLNKLLTHAALYLVFLVLIFLQSNMNKTGQKRKPPHSGLEPVIIVFVVGNIWNCMRMCLIQGPRRYFKLLWNLHAVVTNMLFVLTFVFWLASYIDAKNNDQVDLERKYWHHLDPILIAEGCFAIATIMAFFKLMYFCRLNYYLGPLQISLGKMCADMAKYLTIFIIIIVSFSSGVCRLYQYYDSMVQVDSNGIKTQQVSSFVDITTTLKTFFWALLCMAPLESADVIIENLPGDKENTTIINTHTFTEAIGYIAFAVFEVLTVVMIMNMLIATMSSTFQRVIDNLDIEWTFGKTDFYLEYMAQSTLAPPLNLIPTPSGINHFMSLFHSTNSEVRKWRRRRLITETFLELANGWTMRKPKVNHMHTLQEPGSENDFPALMSQLIQRYFREKDSSGNGATDLETLKQDISELRQLLQDVIGENA